MKAPLVILSLLVLASIDGRAEDPLPPGVERRPPSKPSNPADRIAKEPLPPGVERRPPSKPWNPADRKVLGQWQGRVGYSPWAIGGPFVIGDRPSLVAIWRDWNIEGDMPEIDFRKELFVATVFRGSQVSKGQPHWSENGHRFRFVLGGTLDIAWRAHYFAYRLPRGELQMIVGGYRKVPVAPTITGTVTTPDGGRIPEGATAVVQILDLSDPGRMKVIAEQRLAAPEEFPFPYALRFDTSRMTLTAPQNYTLSVAIWKNNRRLYGTAPPVIVDHKYTLRNELRIPVIENGKLRAEVSALRSPSGKIEHRCHRLGIYDVYE